MKSNREIRAEKLEKAGLSGNFFSLVIPKGIKAGDVIQISIAEDSGDEVEKKISEDNFVKNPVLFRRWVTAQMFYMLNYHSWDGTGKEYNYYLNHCLDYNYQFKVMLDECKTLAKLEEKGWQNSEEYKIRSSFFTFEVILITCQNYYDEIEKKFGASQKYNKSENYKYFLINGKKKSREEVILILNDIHEVINWMYECTTYKELYGLLNRLVQRYVKRYKVKRNTLKCKKWKEAYKGAGAYYTLANLVCSHGCVVPVINWRMNITNVLDGTEGMEYVNDKFEKSKATGEWWRLFGFMKKVIEYNDFVLEY